MRGYCDEQILPQGKTLHVKVSGELFGHPEVKTEIFSTFGKARGGNFAISAQYASVRLFIYNKETFYKVLKIIK